MGVDFLAMPLDPEGPPPAVKTLDFSGGGGALHGITQLLGQVVKLAAKKSNFFTKKPKS